MIDLAPIIERAVQQDGLQELLLRVSEYDLTTDKAVKWQAIAKYRGSMRGPWGVGICARPSGAITRALAAGRALHQPEEDIFG